MSLEPGFYPNLSNEDYHADSALGSTGLKLFANECPASFYYEYLNPDFPKREFTKSMERGIAAHIVLLEPEKFDEAYLIAPESVSNKVVKGWKDFSKKCEEGGKKPLLHKEYEHLQWMSMMIKNHELANAMLTNGKAEMSFFCKDTESNLMCKARPDYLVSLKGYGTVLVDYKTTAVGMDTTTQSKHAFNLFRHLQAAHHKLTVEQTMDSQISEVVYITQKPTPPFNVRIFRMTEEDLDLGATIRRNALNGIAECVKSQVWPDYPHEIEDYIRPAWVDWNFN